MQTMMSSIHYFLGTAYCIDAKGEPTQRVFFFPNVFAVNAEDKVEEVKAIIKAKSEIYHEIPVLVLKDVSLLNFDTVRDWLTKTILIPDGFTNIVWDVAGLIKMEYKSPT